MIEAALTPHESYVEPLLRAFRVPGVHAAAHITGGGLIDNLPRVLPDGLAARLSPSAWTIPPLYAWIEQLPPCRATRCIACSTWASAS